MGITGSAQGVRRITMHGEVYVMRTKPTSRTHTTEGLEHMRRLLDIHGYYQDHPGCTINNAITFTPATKSSVGEYSKLRSECVAVMVQAWLTPRTVHKVGAYTNYTNIGLESAQIKNGE